MKNKVKKENKVNSNLTVVIKSFLFFVMGIMLTLIIFGGIYLVDLVYNAKTGNNKKPLFGAYVIVTESMIPTINVNDAVVVKRVEDDNVGVGDIVTFSASSGYYAGYSITHRIVGKYITQSGDFVYRTKGDNNDREDISLVSTDSILGKVILRIPMVGYIQSFVLSPIGFVISIIIPVVIVILYESFRITALWKKRKKEIEII